MFKVVSTSSITTFVEQVYVESSLSIVSTPVNVISLIEQANRIRPWKQDETIQYWSNTAGPGLRNDDRGVRVRML